VIAKRYGVSVKQIIASNSLKSNHVKAGQLLTILRDATDTSNTKNQIKEKTAEKNMSGKKNNAKNSNEKTRVRTKSSQSKSSANKAKIKTTPSKPKRHN
jgi:membrane-bound lytic murein transglycosylase D